MRVTPLIGDIHLFVPVYGIVDHGAATASVLDLPLGSCAPPEGTFTVMANLLGGTDPDVFDRYLHVMAADPAVKVHFYGKEVRIGRKIGHVTIVGGPEDDVTEVRDRARRAASYLRWGTEDRD